MTRAAPWFLAAVIPLRIALDAAWRLPNLGPVTAPQAGSLALIAGIAVAVALRWRAAATHPARIPIAGFALAVVIGAARADRPFDAVHYGIAYLAPVGWALALWAWPEVARAPGLPRSWIAAAAVAVASSLACLAIGQPADHVLHGWPRLIGLYGNLHGHAAAMAAFAVTFGALGAIRRSPGLAGIGAAAAVCVGATWVRGAWAWVGLGWLVAAAVYARSTVGQERRRAIAAAGVLVGGAGLALAVGGIRARWADVGAVATLTAPDGGWGALGSWRGRIWADVVHNHLAGPWTDVALGRGLGGQLGLHRHLDPHSDALSLAVALGPLGLAAWFAWLGATLRASVRATHDPRADKALAAAACGALAGALAVAVISNDVLDRPTPLWWVVGAAGLALRRPEAAGSASPGGASGAPPGPTPG